MATARGRKRTIFASRALAPSASSSGVISSALAVGRGEPDRGVDQMGGDAGPQQGRVEPVAAWREVALHGDAAQAGIDADEQQPNAVGDQVRQGGSGERLQFGAGETDVPGWPQLDSPLPRAN